MNLKDIQDQILYYMTDFVLQVKGATYIGRTDFNRVSETILVDLLKEVYDLPNLRNLNQEKTNYPGIDLGDDVARIAFQVTATPDSEKVKETIRQFVEHDLYKKYDRLVIYILTEKQKSYSDRPFREIIGNRFNFDVDKDIIDFRDILYIVKDFPLDKAIKIQSILAANFQRGEIVSLEERDDSRRENIFLNLVELSFPRELYVAEVDIDSTQNNNKNTKRRKRFNKRSELQSILREMGWKFGMDWEYYEGKILTFHDLGDQSLSISNIIDSGTIEVFKPEEFYGINEDYERVFKSLLRRCLQQKLYHEGIQWQNEEKLFIFQELDGKPTRTEQWQGKVKSQRVVYLRTMKTNKPDETLNCKHFAFAADFKYINEKWYLLVRPDWFFSFDGYRKNYFCEDNLKWIKKKEKNSNVFAHLRFISYFISDKDLELYGVRKIYPFLSFGEVVQFTNAPFLDDRLWNPNEPEKTTEPEDADENQNNDEPGEEQLSLWGDL